VFSVTLHHQFVYTQEEKVWLESFEDLALSHQEKTIVRLGYDGRLVSPKVIWDAVGIVDTDYYRQVLSQLGKKGVLQHSVNKLTAQKTARRKRLSVKEVLRFLKRVDD
jgi:ATP-dependent DNA helicase RecG